MGELDVENINKAVFGVCLLKCGLMFFLLSSFEVRLGIPQVKFCCLEILFLESITVGFYLHMFRAARFKRSAWTNFVSGKLLKVITKVTSIVIHAYELMLGLHVFRQTGPPRRVDCLAPPSVCHIKTEASR